VSHAGTISLRRVGARGVNDATLTRP